MVPIERIRTVPRADAYWEKGLFANQNGACKLNQELTLDRLASSGGRDFISPRTASRRAVDSGGRGGCDVGATG